MSFPDGRTAGVGLHLTSLPGRYGSGDLGAGAHAFLDWTAKAGLRVWQFLPLGPTAYGDSPYQPLSTRAGNELLVDLAPLLAANWLAASEVEELERLPSDTVAYDAAIPLKMAALATAADRFAASAEREAIGEYGSFLAENDDLWLHDYALYRVLKMAHGEKPWPDWEPRFSRRDPDALTEAEDSFGREIERVKIVQYWFAQQWRTLRGRAKAMGVTLFGDLPIYIGLDSADAWAEPTLVQLDDAGRPTQVAGVPPDYFSAEGQLWGNPLYDWGYHRASGYAWWIERMRHMMRRVDLIRIDHFRGFESYWAVPGGDDTARHGEWLAGPGDDLFRSLREALGEDLPIVAEDLGIITPAVEALRDRLGFPGMKVLQFLLDDPQFSVAHMPEYAVCYTGTHDNDTTLGWFYGSSAGRRTEDEIAWTKSAVLARTGGDETSVARDVLRLAFQSPARLAIAPLQDYLGLGSAARLNVPGTTADNWQWRVSGDALTADLAADIAALVEASGRGAKVSPDGDRGRAG